MDTVKGHEILPLDSEIFGFGVARILPATLTPEELARILASLKEQGVRLVFWASDPGDGGSQRAAQACEGFLADRKATYLVDLALAPPRPVGTAWPCREYADGACCPDLEALALEVARHSRFGADPRIPVTGSSTLYRTWIRNSVNRTVADAVLVACQADRIIGMATVGVKNGRGFIGLFAVAPGMREQKVGVSLVRAAQAWTAERGLRYAQVVTQQDNVAACRLYEKSGFRLERVEYFYHFWIGGPQVMGSGVRPS
jgi:dTDP-4-amino-4,6-dideoxy-D-galactose acyltransferase